MESSTTVLSKPKLFIGSSVEGLNIAYAIQQELEFACYPTVWSQGIFKPEIYPKSKTKNYFEWVRLNEKNLHRRIQKNGSRVIV